jgi:hypothetical protein
MLALSPLGISPLLRLRATAAPSALRSVFEGQAVIERRVYDRRGAVPPVRVMRRCGIALLSSENAGTEVVLKISFPSLAERTCAWDRFNSDPEWCALRATRAVRLTEISILSPSA